MTRTTEHSQKRPIHPWARTRDCLLSQHLNCLSALNKAIKRASHWLPSAASLAALMTSLFAAAKIRFFSAGKSVKF